MDIDRQAAARYGLNIADVQSIVSGAIGGENIGETIEGLARFPISLRYPRDWRDSLGALEQLPIYTPLGSQITLGTVARVRVSDGPPMLKSENARPSGWVYVDVRGRDLASVVADLRRAVSEQVRLQPGMSLGYSGQFEFLERANARLAWLVPATLLIIFVLLYLTFARFDEALLIMATLPFALTGGAWFLYWLGFNLSVATGVGFIALAGVSAEFGVIMLLYLKNAWAERQESGEGSERGLLAAIREGAVQRVRPKAMTVAVIIAGLLPILLDSGTGSEVMSRIAAPMVGGMLTAPLLSLFVIPAAYRLMRRRHLPVVSHTQGKTYETDPDRIHWHPGHAVPRRLRAGHARHENGRHEHERHADEAGSPAGSTGHCRGHDQGHRYREAAGDHRPRRRPRRAMAADDHGLCRDCAAAARAGDRRPGDLLVPPGRRRGHYRFHQEVKPRGRHVQACRPRAHYSQQRRRFVPLSTIQQRERPMNNTELSHLILSDHSRIEAAISTGAAWEVWFQVEFLMLLRAAHLGVAREVPYPPPNQALHLDVLARHNVESYAIEVKVESATNAGNKLLAETRKDIEKIAKYTEPVDARWVVSLAYSDVAKHSLRGFTVQNNGHAIYHESGAIGCMIVTV